MRSQPLYVADIVTASRFACDFVSGMTFEEFMNDERTRSAVVQKLLVIGEAAKSIDDATRALDSTIPWKIMSGMRDRLMHGYFGIDYAIVWRVVHAEIPDLSPRLASILRAFEGFKGTP